MTDNKKKKREFSYQIGNHKGRILNFEEEERSPQWMEEPKKSVFMKWSWMDYTILIIFLFGTIFLLADLLSVMRDREFYPSYYHGYLLFGFVLNVTAMILLFIRLGVVLAKIRLHDSPLFEHHNQPTQADHSE